MKKTNKIVFILALILPLCSCQYDNRSALEKEIDAVNAQCDFRLNSKLEDFPVSWYGSVGHSNDKFSFKETRDDGVDVYTCGSYDTLPTEFYYRDGLEVGFKTADPQFGFSIFGRYIGTPIYHFQGYSKKDLYGELMDRGYEWEPNIDHDREATAMPNGDRYSWNLLVFEGKLHINYSRDVIYAFNGSLKEIEVFLDK